jgi:hypothetical protein
VGHLKGSLEIAMRPAIPCGLANEDKTPPSADYAHVRATADGIDLSAKSQGEATPLGRIGPNSI